MKKSPYMNFTLDEVAKIERTFFTIHFGGDFLLHDKSYLFTQKEAIKLYKSTMNDLMGIVRDGTEKDRAYALDLMWTTVIEPLILH
jgi:hypothetical protein